MCLFAGEGPLQILLLKVVKPCQCDFLVVKGCKISPLGFGFSVGCFGMKCDFFFNCFFFCYFLKGLSVPSSLSNVWSNEFSQNLLTLVRIESSFFS